MARIYDNTKSPILNNPYEEPRLYYDTDMDGNLDYMQDTRFADNFLIVAPGITIRDRLSVLYLENSRKARSEMNDYYHRRDLIPRHFEPLLGGLNASITIINYQQLEPKHQYMPDFIARVETPRGENVNLMIEISGFSDDRTGHKDAKSHYTLDYWLPAANNLGQYGRWAFVEVSDIDNIKRTLIHKIQEL